MNGPRLSNGHRSIAAEKFRIRREQLLRLLGDEQGIVLMHARFHSCVKVVGLREHVAAIYWYNLYTALTSPALTIRLIVRFESGIWPAPARHH